MVPPDGLTAPFTIVVASTPTHIVIGLQIGLDGTEPLTTMFIVSVQLPLAYIKLNVPAVAFVKVTVATPDVVVLIEAPEGLPL